MSETRSGTAAVVEGLETADAAYREAVDAVEEIGERRLERLAERLAEFEELLDRYEEPASGSGRETFEAYVEFEGRVVDFIEGLPDDLLRRGAFERASEVLDKRRLSPRDFERAREELAPARGLAARLDERDDALGEYRDARRAVEARRRDLDGRIDDLEADLAFADADLDAPVERLREPIEAYDGAVREAFDGFVSRSPAREVLAFLDATAAYPLIGVRSPPGDLRRYLDGNEVGREPVPTLLDYVDYSRSKLDHYVDDPGEFKARVGGHRTYLSRLSTDPLAVGWPPPPADELRWRARELVAVVDRFAPDDVVGALHEVRELARDPEYGRLRRAARAREELDRGERERLQSGRLERELEELRAERDRLREALSGFPDR